LGLFRHRALRRLAPTRPVSGTFSKTLSRLASSSRSTCDALRRHQRGAFGTRICGRCLIRGPVARGPPFQLAHDLDARILTRLRRQEKWTMPRAWHGGPWATVPAWSRLVRKNPHASSVAASYLAVACWYKVPAR